MTKKTSKKKLPAGDKYGTGTKAQQEQKTPPQQKVKTTAGLNAREVIERKALLDIKKGKGLFSQYQAQRLQDLNDKFKGSSKS